VIPASGLILSVNSLNNAVFSVVAAFLGDDTGWLVAEFETVDLQRECPRRRLRAGGVSCTVSPIPYLYVRPK
jgi:hypothetical protein